MKPDYRLMARSGVPVAELLLVQRRHAPPSPWTVLEYALAIGLILGFTAACIVAAWWTMDLLRL